MRVDNYFLTIRKYVYEANPTHVMTKINSTVNNCDGVQI